MALNSSGPISLAGTTAGQSIELELGGGGFTMISLNDATVRGLAGVASGAISMPADFWGKSAGSYWIGYFAVPASTLNYSGSYSNPLILPNGDMIFVQHYSLTNVSPRLRLTRLTKDGTYVSCSDIIVAGTTTSIFCYQMLLASSGNSFYITGRITKSDTTTRGYAYVAKISTSLSTLEATSLLCSRGTTTSYSCSTIEIGSDGDIFAGYQQLGLVKLNPTNLAVNSQTNLNGAYYGIKKISDGSIFGANTGFTQFFKASSTGVFGTEYAFLTTSWQMAITGTGYAYDATNNNYICGNYTTAAGAVSQVVVLNPLTGVVKWAMQTNLPATPAMAFVTYDSDGNIYSASALGSLLCKFNSVGTLIWQRSFTSSSTSARVAGLTATSDGLYIQWSNLPTAPATNPMIVAKLPKDGSKTGVYTISGIVLTYANTSYTISAFTPTTTSTGTSTMYPPVYYTAPPTISAQTTTFTPTAI